MKKVISALNPFLSEITHDFMMAVCIAAPIIMGVAFQFLLPVLESVLCKYFTVSQIISLYYRIFDLIIAIMTPIMFCFAGVLVMLEEFDNGIAKYYFVTPVGKSGYLLSRLGIPALLAIVYDILLLWVFTVTKIDFLMTVIFAVGGGLMAIVTSLFVVAFAKNKIEGMALIKLCGLLILGIPAVYFVDCPIQYIFSLLPSFWLAKISITGNYLFIIPTIITTLIIILCLYGKFKNKLL